MMVKLVRAAAVVLFLGIALASFPVRAQDPVQPIGTARPPAPPPTDPQFAPRRNQQPDPIEIRMERDREKALQKERFESLKKDTDKLLKLANELKENVDKASKDTLSLEVIRKTEEIEKLAKQVREKMKAQ